MLRKTAVFFNQSFLVDLLALVPLKLLCPAGIAMCG